MITWIHIIVPTIILMLLISIIWNFITTQKNKIYITKLQKEKEDKKDTEILNKKIEQQQETIQNICNHKKKYREVCCNFLPFVYIYEKCSICGKVIKQLSEQEYHKRKKEIEIARLERELKEAKK